MTECWKEFPFFASSSALNAIVKRPCVFDSITAKTLYKMKVAASCHSCSSTDTTELCLVYFRSGLCGITLRVASSLFQHCGVSLCFADADDRSGNSQALSLSLSLCSGPLHRHTTLGLYSYVSLKVSTYSARTEKFVRFLEVTRTRTKLTLAGTFHTLAETRVQNSQEFCTRVAFIYLFHRKLPLQQHFRLSALTTPTSNFWIVVGHHTRNRFCPGNVSRTSCENSQTWERGISLLLRGT